MGKILVTNSTKKDALTGEVFLEESNLIIEIQDEADRVDFNTFLYCASAMRTYPFEVPYDTDSLEEYDLSATPECSFCTFKDTERWESNIEHNQEIDMDAYRHPTSLYKELKLDGSLKNTTYLDIVEEYRKYDEERTGPFYVDLYLECPSCGDRYAALHVSPSLDKLIEEEQEMELNRSIHCINWDNGLQTSTVYITQEMRDLYQKDLDWCLGKKFGSIVKIIFSSNNEKTEVFRRLLTPKHKKYFKGLSIPVKFNGYRKDWKVFLES